ncbi:type II toxin-antitoxin system prevent-host-death family antitoxin [Luteolibacter sp. Populi]|uniref:type II toxin-antitoxin system prevent-host-death family antitoxin n=1 Tax=Luteolibacter sp. Populi TaxID=3230487 RepID=UPI0034669BA5
MKKAEKEPEIITRGGKPVSVILPIAQYERLLQRLEDAEDTACLKKARAKTLSFRPLESYLAERRKSGV